MQNQTLQIPDFLDVIPNNASASTIRAICSKLENHLIKRYNCVEKWFINGKMCVESTYDSRSAVTPRISAPVFGAELEAMIIDALKVMLMVDDYVDIAHKVCQTRRGDNVIWRDVDIAVCSKCAAHTFKPYYEDGTLYCVLEVKSSLLFRQMEAAVDVLGSFDPAPTAIVSFHAGNNTSNITQSLNATKESTIANNWLHLWSSSRDYSCGDECQSAKQQAYDSAKRLFIMPSDSGLRTAGMIFGNIENTPTPNTRRKWWSQNLSCTESTNALGGHADTSGYVLLSLCAFIAEILLYSNALPDDDDNETRTHLQNIIDIYRQDMNTCPMVQHIV